MENKEKLTERSQRIRQAMEAHVARRLAKALAKWDGKNDAMARQGIAAAHEKYQLSNILEKGSKANGMAIATHIAKGIHPDLKIKQATNLCVRFHELAALTVVSSHVLNSQESLADATGDGAYNAAAYELYLILDCQVENATLGALLQLGDSDAVSALAYPSAEAEKAAEEIVLLLESKCVKPSVQTLSKQIYWFSGSNPASNNDYCCWCRCIRHHWFIKPICRYIPQDMAWQIWLHARQSVKKRHTKVCMKSIENGRSKKWVAKSLKT